MTDTAPGDLSGLAERFGRTYKPGEVIFSQGESGEHLYVILRGKVTFSAKHPTGATRIIRSAGPGELFGEMSCLSDRPRSATAIAVYETHALQLDREAVDELVKTTPAFATKIIHTLGNRLRATASHRA